MPRPHCKDLFNKSFEKKHAYSTVPKMMHDFCFFTLQNFKSDSGHFLLAIKISFFVNCPSWQIGTIIGCFFFLFEFRDRSEGEKNVPSVSDGKRKMSAKSSPLQKKIISAVTECAFGICVN